jgi:hypothetical protein
MKKLLKVVYVLGVLFWGSFSIHGIAMLVAYNGFGSYHDFACKNANDLQVIDMTNYYRISYSYNAGGDAYKKTEEVSKEFFRERIGQIPAELEVCYNVTYPNLSFIKHINLAIIEARTGIVISSFSSFYFHHISLCQKRLLDTEVQGIF